MTLFKLLLGDYGSTTVAVAYMYILAAKQQQQQQQQQHAATTAEVRALGFDLAGAMGHVYLGRILNVERPASARAPAAWVCWQRERQSPTQVPKGLRELQNISRCDTGRETFTLRR